MKFRSYGLLTIVTAMLVLGLSRSAFAVQPPVISAEVGAAFTDVRTTTILGTTHQRSSSPTFGLGLRFDFEDWPLSLGAVFETMSLEIPNGAKKQLVAAKLRAEVSPLRSVLPEYLILRLGMDAGVGVVNGGVHSTGGVHVAAGYVLGHGVSVVARGLYDWFSIPVEGECPTVSPIAGCGYGARAARATLGVEYAW